jgi:endonuclease G
MYDAQKLERAARARITDSETVNGIRNTIKKVREGRPLAAETDQSRLTARLMVKANVSHDEAKAMAADIKHAPLKKLGAEAIQGDTLDFVPACFLEKGVKAARAVARVRTPSDLGTGFMVSEDLFVTNNHVIPSAEIAALTLIEFDYETDFEGLAKKATVYTLDPGRFFMTDDIEKLDFTLVAIGKKRSGAGDLKKYSYCALSKAKDKHALGEVANIVQHPQGRFKELVLRENRLAHRSDEMLFYIADTEGGSSGSPVFNNEWQAIALHHWGGPSKDFTDDTGKKVPQQVNEGIRASRIVTEIERRAHSLTEKQREILRRAQKLHGSESLLIPEIETEDQEKAFGATISPDGTATWRIPIEISVRLPILGQTQAAVAAPSVQVARSDDEAAERKVEVDPDYDNRKGYQAEFIKGFDVPLPELSTELKRSAAKLKEPPRRSDNPFELKYHHFSVVMNAERKLAFFTACNIDGKTAKNVDRQTGNVTPAKLGDQESMEAAEARESWFTDPRIDGEAQTPDELYLGQKTFLDDGRRAKNSAHLSRIFQRGHLVRRKDPAWGDNDIALSADADTFHFTNCTPQVGFFNMGKGPKDMPGTGGGKLWRAIEDYVLDNAIADGLRVSVFTGPVFVKNDLPWRTGIVKGFRIPQQFWKIVVWTEEDKLRATAMLASQKPLLDKFGLPEAALPERFDDTEDVQDFVTSVAHIEDLTGLSFGKALRNASTFKAARGKTKMRVKSMREVFQLK